MLRCLFLIAAVGHIALQSAVAEDLDATSPTLKLHGFGTFGLVRSNDETLVYAREVTQPAPKLANDALRRDSRFGLQLNYLVSPRVEMVAQVVAQERAVNTLENSVEWAFVKFKPHPEWDVRVGRVGIDAFLLSDYRNVGYAYPWVRPPLEFYSWFIPTSLDGLDVVKRWDAEGGQIRAKFFAGQASNHIPLAGENVPFKIKPMFGVRAEYETGFWRLRSTLTRGRITSHYLVPTALVDAVTQAAPLWSDSANLLQQYTTEGTRLRYASLGLGYDDGRWQILSELSHSTSEREGIPRGTRGYISLGRRFDEWMPYVVLSKARDPRHVSVSDPQVPALYPLRDLAVATINRYRVEQTGLALGVRWDWTANAALKLQYDRAKVPSDGLLLWYMKPGRDWEGGHRNLLSLSLDFVF